MVQCVQNTILEREHLANSQRCLKGDVKLNLRKNAADKLIQQERKIFALPPDVRELQEPLDLFLWLGWVRLSGLTLKKTCNGGL
jgi:hypothetical protein